MPNDELIHVQTPEAEEMKNPLSGITRADSWLESVDWEKELGPAWTEPIIGAVCARRTLLPLSSRVLLAATFLVGYWTVKAPSWNAGSAITLLFCAGVRWDWALGFVALILSDQEVVQTRRRFWTGRWFICARSSSSPSSLDVFVFRWLPGLYLLGNLPRRPYVSKKARQKLIVLLPGSSTGSNAMGPVVPTPDQTTT